MNRASLILSCILPVCLLLGGCGPVLIQDEARAREIRDGRVAAQWSLTDLATLERQLRP